MELRFLLTFPTLLSKSRDPHLSGSLVAATGESHKVPYTEGSRRLLNNYSLISWKRCTAGWCLSSAAVCSCSPPFCCDLCLKDAKRFVKDVPRHLPPPAVYQMFEWNIEGRGDMRGRLQRPDIQCKSLKIKKKIMVELQGNAWIHQEVKSQQRISRHQAKESKGPSSPGRDRIAAFWLIWLNFTITRTFQNVQCPLSTSCLKYILTCPAGTSCRQCPPWRPFREFFCHSG